MLIGRKRRRTAAKSARGPKTLAVDIGGTGVKAAVLDARGRMISDRLRLLTPKHMRRKDLVALVSELAEQLPKFDRVSVGFPGVVRRGVILTAHNIGTEEFHGFDLARALEKRLGKPVRVANDADVQGLAAIRGKGVEMVITLGTGFGSSIFVDGRLGPHLELAHHISHDGRTYEEELGEKAMLRDGEKVWSHRVAQAIDRLRALVNFDHLYIGGGNARRLQLDLPKDVTIVDNTAGILGGIRLWND